MSDNPYAGLQLSQLLDLLEPVTEPARPSLFPQTSGWIVLLAVVLVALLWGGRKVAQHRQENAYRRLALEAVNGAGDDPASLARILRMTALSAYPRDQIAGLTGADWLTFLDKSGGESGFCDGPGATLAIAPYQDVPHNPELTALVRRWIQHHKPLQDLT